MADVASRARLLLAVVVCAGGLRAAAQEPRIRGGANPVRLDVYVTRDGTPVDDLTAADFEVVEDAAPQAITAFEVVRPSAAQAARGTAPGSPHVFVLFLDTPHLQMPGAYRADSPVAAVLDRVVAAGDPVGVMTPDMTARNMTLSPRTATIGEMLRTSWAWGDRSRSAPADARETDLRECYPDAFSTSGLAEAIIAKRREQKTLRALTDLVQHLEQVRDERTTVWLLSEGWVLGAADEELARAVTATTATAWCERERALVALTDLRMELRLLTQRANRANVSVYPVDVRGLVTADVFAPAPSPASAAAAAARRASLTTLAADTDGAPIDGAAIDQASARLLADAGVYYLLGFVSSNPKADGTYRRLTVRVRRPGVTVRTRAGYLAPSQAEAGPPPSAKPRVSSAAAASATGVPRAPSSPRGLGDALARLPVSRRPPALHVQAAGGRGVVRLVVELDRTTVAAPEWSRGGAIVVDLEPADGTASPRRTSRAEVAAGDRIRALALPEGELLRPGRYQVRVQATPDGGRSPITITAPVEIPGPAALVGSAVLATRRGPGTGRSYEPTADVRFRRTERLALEVAKLTPDVQLTGRLMNTAGQVLQVPVSVTERAEPSGPPTFVADVMLAPLAAGEYVIELVATAGEKSETRSFALRMVP